MASRRDRWRRILWMRDPACVLCGEVLKLKDVTLDHIVPRSRGGKHALVNCQVACVDCNRLKAADLIERW
jgi:5-methylcytosine-specific restriction endonuclease McrA